MDAVEFLTNVNRIYSNNGCINECPLKTFCDTKYYGLDKKTINAAVKAVEKWVKDHPKRTRQSEFLKEFPNVVVGYGTINILPCWLDKTLAQDCDGVHPRECIECKKAYWGKEIE